jgi:hypothetical protein
MRDRNRATADAAPSAPSAPSAPAHGAADDELTESELEAASGGTGNPGTFWLTNKALELAAKVFGPLGGSR